MWHIIAKGCDSEGIFDRLQISKSPSYKENINKYDVIHFDVQWCMMDAGSPDKTVNYINEQIIAELKETIQMSTLILRERHMVLCHLLT